MNKTYRIGLMLVVMVIVVVALIHVARTAEKSPQSSQKLQVTASFYPLYFFAQAIGGDKAEVYNVTPASAEPHDYEPTAEDSARIEDSQLVILNGGGLEVWGENVSRNFNPQKTTFVVAGEGLTTQQVVEDGEKIIDPHVWQSPLLAEQMVDKIAGGFAAVDPTHSQYYQSNASVLKSKLNELDQLYRTGLSSCAQKNIITSHAAFGYLATTYGLTQVPIAGLSPDAEPSAQQLAAIAKFAKDNHVTYIFFESLVSPKLSETIAREVGAKTLVLNPIEGLSPEELAQGKDYFTEMKQNLANLKIALQCKP